jgi:DNA-binding MarR family transcriptional regulator
VTPQAKLIARTRGDHDRRLVLLTPTANGKRTVNRALRPLHASLGRLQRRYDADELEKLAAFLVGNDALIETGE